MNKKDICNVVKDNVEKVAAKYLGKNTNYDLDYDPDILNPFSRAESLKSCKIDINEYLYYGFDLWNMWEVRYKLKNGKSVQRIGKLIYEAHSPKIIESKSMKLYFFSQMFDKFTNDEKLSDKLFSERVTLDISRKIESICDFKLYSQHDYYQGLRTSKILDPLAIFEKIITPNNEVIDSIILDNIDIPDDFAFHKAITGEYEINYDNASLIKGSKRKNRKCSVFKLYSGRSNCLITKQLDIFSELIVINGEVDIDPLSLLDYIQSFETVNRFHESTAHTIFDRLVWLIREFDPYADISVFSMYTRRGGIDINPFRTTSRDVYNEVYNYVNSNVWVKSWNQ